MLTEIITEKNTNYELELTKLGLTESEIQEVGKKIIVAFNQATKNDAASASGIYAYLTAVRALRDLLCPKGWKVVRCHNLETTENKDKTISILVSSGDINTGNPEITPKTKNPKGEQTRKVVYQNAKNELFYEFDLKHTSISKIKPFWVFLYRIDKDMEQMRMEISLPIEMDYHGTKIDDWKKRIIISPIDFKPSPVVSEPDFAEDFEFKIKRRSNEE